MQSNILKAHIQCQKIKHNVNIIITMNNYTAIYIYFPLPSIKTNIIYYVHKWLCNPIIMTFFNIKIQMYFMEVSWVFFPTITTNKNIHSN